MHAALNPNSRGWFGVAAYVQSNNGVGNNWQAISRANIDMWILGWVSANFIIHHCLSLGSHKFQCHITTSRLKVVINTQAILKRYFDQVLSLHIPLFLDEEKIRARNGLEDFMNV